MAWLQISMEIRLSSQFCIKLAFLGDRDRCLTFEARLRSRLMTQRTLISEKTSILIQLYLIYHEDNSIRECPSVTYCNLYQQRRWKLKVIQMFFNFDGGEKSETLLPQHPCRHQTRDRISRQGTLEPPSRPLVEISPVYRVVDTSHARSTW